MYTILPHQLACRVHGAGHTMPDTSPPRASRHHETSSNTASTSSPPPLPPPSRWASGLRLVRPHRLSISDHGSFIILHSLKVTCTLYSSTRRRRRRRGALIARSLEPRACSPYARLGRQEHAPDCTMTPHFSNLRSLSCGSAERAHATDNPALTCHWQGSAQRSTLPCD